MTSSPEVGRYTHEDWVVAAKTEREREREREGGREMKEREGDPGMLGVGEVFEGESVEDVL